jgi:DNA repair exonuclease SbcCD nuclease subunit
MLEKSIILGDCHFDEKHGDAKLLKIQQHFFDSLIQYCVDNEINRIYQVGDITHNRTSLSLNVQSSLLRIFMELEMNQIEMVYIIGNHDIFYKDSREIFSMEVFEKAFPTTFKVIKEPTLLDDIYLVPWMVSGEKLNVPQGARAIIGHFEMKDFYVTKTFKSEHGLTKDQFKDIPVFSGHYHLKQDVGNIHYVGTPYQLDWNDFNSLKGIHILDHSTMTATFVENKSTTQHIKLYLDVDTKKVEIEGYSGVSSSDASKILDVIVNGPHKFKIYAKKELAITKKLVEILEGASHTVKLEIMPEEEEIDIEERLEKVKALSISDSIIAIVDDDDKSITHDIITEAKSLMMNDKGGE